MRTKTKRLFGILLGLALALGLVPGTSMLAYADSDQEPVKYLDEYGDEQTCTEYTEVTSSTSTIGIENKTAWCVVKGEVVINATPLLDVASRSDTRIILCDNAKLTVDTINKPTSGTRITIYSQSMGADMGKLEAALHVPNITINGGDVTAYDSYGEAISAYQGLTINGGKVSATTGSEYDYKAIDFSSTWLKLGAGVSLYGNDSYMPVGSGETDRLAEGPATYTGTCYKYMKTAFVQHTHSFTYEANGAVITATCANSDGNCSLDDGTAEHNHTATLTIEAPALTTEGDDESAEATITDVQGIKGNAVVSYFNADESGNKTGKALAGAPADAGKYWAEITLGTGAGSATAHVVYDIKEIIYTVMVDGAKATVTDDREVPNTYTAELIGLPDDKTYDGETVNLSAVSVAKSDGFPEKVTVGAVSIKDENNNDVTTATDVGAYTVSASVGDKTISKVFRINGRTPSVTYVKTTKQGGDYVVTKTTTNQYIPLEDNPDGITLLEDGRIYVASGNIGIGALVYRGNVKLILLKDTTVTIYAGIYHIGSSLEIYTEEGGENAALDVKGNIDLSSLSNYSDYSSKLDGTGSSLSGSVLIYGEKVTFEKGLNTDVVADDISLTVGAGMSAKGSKNDSALNSLTGGTENSDGSITYNKNDIASFVKIVVENTKESAAVSKAPTSKDLVYDAVAQELVTKGEASGGTMQYALGNETEATEAYTASVPTATDAGTYHVWYRVAGDDNHEDSAPASVAVTIGRADVSKAKVTLAKASYVYNGKAREPKVKSVVLDGRTLKVGADYSVSYKGNVKPGTATATITGKGNYRGTARAAFTIALAKTRGLSTAGHPAKGTLDASWRVVAGATSYELSWHASGGKRKTKAVKGTSATIKGLEEGKCYEVRVRAKAGSTAGEWSKSSSRWLRKVSSVKARAGKLEGSIKVCWAADAEATGGYVAYACASKDGAVLARKAVSAGKTSATLTGLESGKAYYVKVRPLREVSDTTYVGVVRYCKVTAKAK